MKLLVCRTAGNLPDALAEACREKGWEVAVRDNLPEDETADAVLLLADAGRLPALLGDALNFSRARNAPLLLATNLDRSGWDRTFGSADALQVDALFDLAVDAGAVIRRLQGILDARARTESQAPPDATAPILERAIAGEEAAAAFYRHAADAAQRPDTREALEGLARDEEEHKRMLLDFKTGKAMPPAQEVEEGGILEAQGAPEFTPDMSPADAFLLAARKEKLAADFYRNWAEIYPPGPERDLLEKLAEVEGRHKAAVEAMFTNAAFPERW